MNFVHLNVFLVFRCDVFGREAKCGNKSLLTFIILVPLLHLADFRQRRCGDVCVFSRDQFLSVGMSCVASEGQTSTRSTVIILRSHCIYTKKRSDTFKDLPRCLLPFPAPVTTARFPANEISMFGPVQPAKAAGSHSESVRLGSVRWLQFKFYRGERSPRRQRAPRRTGRRC